MFVFISCAKTMSRTVNKNLPLGTTPIFQKNASEIALQMSQFSVKELEQTLRINSKIAYQNYQRYQEFHGQDEHTLPAILSYTGMVFKQLNPKDFTAEDFLYAQDHLFLTSFCYGLLRPLDLIRPYRLEGSVRLPEFGDITMYEYWRSRLTDLFISTIQAQGGILINLASEEMKHLFDWKRVESSVRVITPEFKTWKNDKLTSIVIYTKMARGQMTRMILKNRLEDPEALKGFDWEGFVYHPDLSTESNWIFVPGFK